jgi:hypothetical protein
MMMPTTHPGEQEKAIEVHKLEALNALIGKQVMYSLGEPASLQKVLVRRLWKDYYRVNVLVGADAASIKIANSYFVEADGDGKIVTSNPQIKKQYGPVTLVKPA